MSKLNLRTALAMKNATGSINAIKGVGFDWAKPVHLLSDYYGIGPGQIPLHHAPSNPANLTVDGNNLIMASTNLGGAGAAFDLTSTATTRAPTYTDASFAMNNAIDKSMSFTSAAQHAGVHSVTAIKLGTISANYLAIFSHGNLWQRIYVRTDATPPRFAVMNNAKAIPIQGNINNIGDEDWCIAELRMDASGTAVLINGQIVTQNTTVVSDYQIAYVGYGGSQSQVTIGNVGDFASVICASGHSASNPEPAVLQARQTIAASYGVVL